MVTHEPGTQVGMASEQQFRRLVKRNAPDRLDQRPGWPHGRYLNDYWYQFSGIERTSAGCESWLAAVYPDDEQVCREAWHAAIQSGLPFEMECRFWDRSSGTHHWFLGRAAPSRSDDGTVLCWFGTATDIDDFKRAQTEIRALNLDLEKRVGRA